MVLSSSVRLPVFPSWGVLSRARAKKLDLLAPLRYIPVGEKLFQYLKTFAGIERSFK